MKRRSFLKFFGFAAAAPVAAKAVEAIPAVAGALEPAADRLGTSVASAWPARAVFAGGTSSMFSCTVIEPVAFRTLDRNFRYGEENDE